MIRDIPDLHDAVRVRFAHVASCPFEGPRAFFENAGGSLTLRSVVETSAAFASYPDNQGRANAAARHMDAVIAQGRAAMATFLGATDGSVFVGESGTEVLFRLIRTAALGAPEGGTIVGSTLEHPASRSAATRWADVTGRRHIVVPHDNGAGSVGVEAYRAALTPETRVATIIHTSPVTGIAVGVAEIARAIRAVAPACFIIVDGIQYASHGAVDVAALDIDGYAISPYKVFSRHGYGIGWASERLTACPKEQLAGAPAATWELGTRDAGSYATFADVVDYLAWLGGHATDSADPRARIEAAAGLIQAEEAALTDAVMHGAGNQRGLAEMPLVRIIGGPDNPGRKGTLTITHDALPATDLVAHLGRHGIRTHVRKADHYSGAILAPLGIDAAVRVSMSHYNSAAEVAQFLAAMAEVE